MKSKKGQIFVELVLGAQLFGFFLMGLVQLSQIFITRHQLQVCAELGATLLASNLISNETMNREVGAYADKVGLNQRLGFRFDYGPYKETHASRFYSLVQGRAQAGPFFGQTISERFVLHQEVQ